jgi:ATP-dependent DNA helicase RecG
LQQTGTILNNSIEYLKGVGSLRADMLKKELSIFTFKDLLEFFPFRHIDKTKISAIKDISHADEFVQVKGRLFSLDLRGESRGKRLTAILQDKDGNSIDLIWFQGVSWVQKTLQNGGDYVAFGRLGMFNGSWQIAHPEMELVSEQIDSNKNQLEPVYSSTEKLKARGLNARQLSKFTQTLLAQIKPADLPEMLPDDLVTKLKLLPRFEAFQAIHYPNSLEQHAQALRRLKFEELFISQLRMALVRLNRLKQSRGVLFEKVGDYFNTFYNQYLPFQLTGAQKRVLKEIRTDTAQGKQMNRLLQGDVGSGKTIVALLSMLIAADNGYQSCLMAPTEILAQQHFNGLSELLKDMPIGIQLLTGSTKTKERKKILAGLADGSVHIIIGTHALIEDPVQFANLGLSVIDEQHRFGVEQRSKLWKKASLPPHVLVMTATPIPRTLAMTAYGDLDYSIMDELPPGRQPISTVHRNEMARSKVMEFVRSEIAKGRQAYIIYPLIEESETLSYEDLMQGYEQVKSYFPEPKYWISMVHGRMAPDVKDNNMQRFVSHDTQIMVATTVIEVGVNVPNASVMVIESAEKFGLSQLHQLRGRVGRGSEKSYCILLTGKKLSNDARERMSIMCATNDGFVIAEKDLELRGPGEIEGTRQSGAINFKLASIVQDKAILETARNLALDLLNEDPGLTMAANLPLKSYLQSQKGKTAWSKIS